MHFKISNGSDSIANDGIFWAFLIGGLLLSISIVVFIATKSNLEFCWTYVGFNNALNYFQFPIKLFSGCLVAAGIRSIMVRSDQTYVQINEAEKQNIFSNYIKHKEEFNKLLDDMERYCEVKFQARETLYISIFELNNFTSFSPIINERFGTFSENLKDAEKNINSLQDIAENLHRTKLSLHDISDSEKNAIVSFVLWISVQPDLLLFSFPERTEAKFHPRFYDKFPNKYFIIPKRPYDLFTTTITIYLNLAVFAYQDRHISLAILNPSEKIFFDDLFEKILIKRD